MPFYKGVSLVSLFDCVATLAEVLGERLRTPEVANLILPLLISKMREFDMGERRLLPLEQVVHAVGTDLVEPYVQDLYTKAVHILCAIMTKIQQSNSEQVKDVWYQGADFIIRSTELLHAICETLKSKTSVLLASDSNQLLAVLNAYASERNTLIKSHEIGLFGAIVHWINIT
jgi:hypothetical protein